ncbi:phosphoribosylamine--glycine ligase [Flavihumibacter petaseus]|uniref:Phosphoribosylamine--glycine ligase n=1 Tax=Flavihumibacter petaseus NBRC 106054 TaxID=1220578 RepID=A0A0E9N569_9BACT|nr:phosphoribosylamine--glycine ligase [Flavihumibacter petaseus]GAO45107.1 phosphoribosylamine--glycine ligase [Flavihumibacter petaseus NBRC 106054]
MNILLLGSGGREHALAWKMSQSPLCSQVYIAPGNAGTAQVGINLALSQNDFPAIRKACLDLDIRLLVVGPEEPLVRGIVDYFHANPVDGMPVIGPSQYGAQLEGSKAFAKAFMERHGIPTAAYREFDADNFEAGLAYIRQHPLPIVLKADGLAAGKGVLILNDREEAIGEFTQMIRQSKFGDASKKVVIEAFLDGIEMSVFVLTDGKDFLLLPDAKDYKRIGEGDTGLNTGGMGAVSPVPFADDQFMNKVLERVVKPTVKGIQEENIDYKGFIFVGLIKVQNEPYVIEYNCRMGDPETEVVMPRLASDLVDLLLATGNQTLASKQVKHDPRVACTVMAVSGGYPGDYSKGKTISGLDLRLPAGSLLFHAGTSKDGEKVVTSGGRVLCVTSYGNSIPEAVSQSKKVLEGITFDGMNYRRDIGYEFE